MADPYTDQNNALHQFQQRVQAQQQERMRAEAMAAGASGPSDANAMRLNMMLQRQQLQMQMATQSDQLRTAMYGTIQPALGAAGPVSQNFGRLVMNSGLGQAMNTLSGGILAPDYSYAWGLTRAQVMQDSSQELKQRLRHDVGNEFIAGLIPDVIRRRTGLAFAGSRPELARGAHAALSGLRGSDIAAFGGGGSVGDIGLTLDSSAVQRVAQGDERAMLALNKRLGYAMGSDETQMLQRVMNRYQVTDAIRGTRPGGDATSTLIQGRSDLVDSIQKLSRSLQLNVDQTEKLVKQGEQHGFSASSGLMRGLGPIARADTGLQMSYEERARAALPIADQAVRLGMRSTTAVQRQFGFAEIALGAYTSGRVSEEQFSRFGGENNAEKAMRQAAYASQLSAGFAMRNASSFGALSKGGWGGGGALQMGTTLGARLAADPTLGLQARVSGSARSSAAASAMVDAYAYAGDTRRFVGAMSSAAGGMAAAQLQFSAMIGESDPVQGAVMYSEMDREVEAYIRDGMSRPEALRAMRLSRLAQEASGGRVDSDKIYRLTKALEGSDITPGNVKLALARENAGISDRAIRVARDRGAAPAPAVRLGLGELRKALGNDIHDPDLLRQVAALSRTNSDLVGTSVAELTRMLDNGSDTDRVRGFDYKEAQALGYLLNFSFKGIDEINKTPDAAATGQAGAPFFVRVVGAHGALL